MEMKKTDGGSKNRRFRLSNCGCSAQGINKTGALQSNCDCFTPKMDEIGRWLSNCGFLTSQRVKGAQRPFDVLIVAALPQSNPTQRVEIAE